MMRLCTFLDHGVTTTLLWENLRDWFKRKVLRRKPKGYRFPNGVPQVRLWDQEYNFVATVPYFTLDLDGSHVLHTDAGRIVYSQAQVERFPKWDLPDDPFDPSDWFDDVSLAQMRFLDETRITDG